MKSIKSGLVLALLGLAIGLFPACQRRQLVIGYLDSGSTECISIAESCAGSEFCCSGVCQNNVCVKRTPACGSADEDCSGPRDCCSSHCALGKCAASCTGDLESCEQNEDCCSGSCLDGSCDPLTSECTSAGNDCSIDNECCSGLCLGGRCDLGSSFCTQAYDVCSENQECCSGTCILSENGYLGHCQTPPSGASNCKGIAGSVCDSCNDCCSRLCVPFGNTGVSVCQQAQGCRQTGEICRQDTECCGGDTASTLPGAGNVSCDIREGSEFGVCRNAMSCSPQGNACHFQNYACSVSAASNKCCAADGGEGHCALDVQGVPRCDGAGASCLDADQLCALDSDCCEGRCLPDSVDQLRCASETSCRSEGDSCTSSADCCPETLCARLSNSSFGVCSRTGAPTCSLSGQLCEGEYPDCCGDFPCNGGYCRGVGAP